MKIVLACLVALLLPHCALSQPLPQFDFKNAPMVAQWTALHDTAPLEATPDGMKIQITGNDPYIAGQPRNYPPGVSLWLKIRCKASASGMGQIFWATPTKGTNEQDSVRFPVPKKSGWQEIRIPLPPLGAQTTLRFDPPGGAGDTCLLSGLTFSTRERIATPQWVRPTLTGLSANSFHVESGTLKLRHSRQMLHAFAVAVGGVTFAVSNNHAVLGYVSRNGATWQNWNDARTEFRHDGSALTVTARLKDRDGVVWQWEQKFAPAKIPNAIMVTTTVRVNAPRRVLYLPLLTVLPGVGTFGGHKTQALFPGLEYLDKDEPSSSEADIIGEGAKRQVPDTAKITIPMMSLLHDGKWLALTWKPNPDVCAVFDSPDRQFHSGGHLMGLMFPGSDGQNRPESSLVPYAPQILLPGKPLTMTATLIGGTNAASVIPSVQQVVGMMGLPPLPRIPSWKQYAELATVGWLDSAIREGDLFRHAYPGDFAAHPAGDAAVMLRLLAQSLPQNELRQRASETAERAARVVPPVARATAKVGHIGTAAPALLGGVTEDMITQAGLRANRAMMRFYANGLITYQKSPDGLDYGRTHFAPDANGMTAQVVASGFDDALLSGQMHLLSAFTVRANVLTKRFGNTVPRGAQTWEIPLHTPDILASAHLVRMYTLAYEWSGEPELLEQARYWAWTGVPFVYLVPPTREPIGIYGTIAVLGATQWVAPNWMGLPVQWCGLVYADALYRLARFDRSFDWKKLADGITASGVQQTWQKEMDKERVGLLPDSFHLRAQMRNDAAINPATLFLNALRLYGQSPLSDYYIFPKHRHIVHAAGKTTDMGETDKEARFTVVPSLPGAHHVLITNVSGSPPVTVNGQPANLTAYSNGQYVLHLSGTATVVIRSGR